MRLTVKQRPKKTSYPKGFGLQKHWEVGERYRHIEFILKIPHVLSLQNAPLIHRNPYGCSQATIFISLYPRSFFLLFQIKVFVHHALMVSSLLDYMLHYRKKKFMRRQEELTKMCFPFREIF